MNIDTTFDNTTFEADFGEVKVVSDGEGGNITVDSQLSLSSTNPVQNKVVTAKINQVENDFKEHKSNYESRVETLLEQQYKQSQQIESLGNSMEDIALNKQDKLTFDEVPTEGSENPVKSSGVAQYIYQAEEQSNRYADDRLQDAKEYTDEKISEIGTGGGGTTPTEKKWEQIVKLVVGEGELKDVGEEGISTIDIAKDDNGKSFEITDFQGLVLYNDASVITGSTVDFSLYIRSGSSSTNRGICKLNITNFTTSSRKWYFRYLYFGENQGGVFMSPVEFCAGTAQYPSSSVTDNKVVYIPSNALNESGYYYNSFKAIVIKPSVPLKVGDTITIWGVRK